MPRKLATATPHRSAKGPRGGPLSLTGAFIDVARIYRVHYARGPVVWWPQGPHPLLIKSLSSLG